jgi:four helix bundle protein
VGDYEKLQVWRVADEVAVKIYVATRTFPADERFGITSQLRRAAVSVPSNIAEGCGRNSNGDLRQFLRVALGSANEVDYQLGLSCRLGYLDRSTATTLRHEVTRVRQMLGKMLLRMRET